MSYRSFKEVIGMKELRCKRCNIYLGEIERGKVKNGAIFLCIECNKAYEILDSLAKHKGSTGSNSIPEGFEELFNKFR